ncbi:N-acetylmuramoyl-L-alanine amidase [Rhodomicrobium sp. Az07]|uniref:N-acetylmuramoyl-L-alanine amidase n=1 Tax=Rhodomicrobium sp. Az07 TaxID=2839034 RepID=UPI001BEB84C6|nr:N-acetylmuramoyl-L-alanine amidase [Rhodomicrobium sp. Az07]MBT3071971.1 N-acetylmuramoyl-L-alanine amidase [Rhodomicrobium sp. Az07]
MKTGLRPSVAFAACCTILVLAFFMGSARAEDIVVSAQIGGDSQRTRFVAFVSKAVEFRAFSMANPYRIVIDMPETDIQVPGAKGRGLILSSRSGLLAPGKSRIVIDLAAPALIEKAELLPPENDLPARLVIDLARTTHKTFFASAKTPPPTPKPDEQQSAAAKPDAGDRRPLIVIDPGHGGIDAGAVGRVTNTLEKDIVFDFCRKLATKLEATTRYRILLTRTSDVFVSLDDRAAIAVKAQADLLISIHADALDPKRLGVKALKEVRGGTIYTLSEEASDEQANVIAQNENKVDVQAGVENEQTTPVVSEEIASILNDLENRIKRNRSASLAHYLIDHMKGKMKFNIRPQRSANFRVLKAHGVPAVLIELGYLSNEDDEKLLISEEWREAIASALGEAVNAFMAERQAHIPL